jgi:MFS family permease
MNSPDVMPALASDTLPPAVLSRRELARLLVLFGTLYFIQGVVEPTANLPYQPLQTQLSRWGYSTGEVGRFFAVIGIAWSIKPLFGLVSDFFPIAGRRRRPYMVLSTFLASCAFLFLAASWPASAGGSSIDGWGRWLLATSPISTAGWLLLLAGVGIALSDVVIDALAVEEGQPRGITGQIQSVQWGAMSVAALLCGSLGGLVAAMGWLRPMLAGCGLLCLVSLVLVVAIVREPPQPAAPQAKVRAALADLLSGRRPAILLSAGAFLFLWNFNPFYSTVLKNYMTDELHFSELFYGHMASLQAAAQTVACGAYFYYCRRVLLGWLVHGSIVGGIVATLAYWLMHDGLSAAVASIVFGLAYQTAVLVQLDLAARICPTSSAGTMFAVLMAISNTGNTCGIYFGGQWYQDMSKSLGSPHLAFDALVLVGAAFTAGCWLLVPLMKWSGMEWRSGNDQ